ncbi:hypothetical protein Tco_0829192 [Tanacetum coccineum]
MTQAYSNTNFNLARTQTFTSLHNGSFSTYSSNVPHGSSNYQSKIKGVLFDFDSHQENRLSSIGTQLKQQQDEVIIKINTLWKNEALPNKGIIKSLSKLLSLKYQVQSLLGKEGGDSSFRKHVHFVNIITIIKKEDEPKEAKPLELKAIESDNHDLDEKIVETELRVSEIMVEKGESSDLGNNDKASDLRHKFIANAYIDLDLPMNVMSLAYYNAIRNQGYEHRGVNFVGIGKDIHVFIGNMSHVMDFTIFENVEANIEPSLSQPEMDDLTSKGNDLLSSRMILSDDDFRRGCECPSDLKSGFYKDIDKLDSPYNWKIKRLDIEGSFEAKGRRKSEGVT